jgi:enoyl-CoA hydratase/carnithine racemase
MHVSPSSTRPQPRPLQPSDIGVDRSNGAIVVVTLNRPQRRNALTLAMWTELGRIFTGFNAEGAVRAVILTGAGGAFSAGADISEFAAVRATPEEGRAYEATTSRCEAAIAACSKPTIAAISGPCYGGGVGVALSCDFRVADNSAHFAIPAARLSNVYGIVETRALSDAVGIAAAKEVLFTGRRYDADEAHRIGLATHRADGAALEGAVELARSMLKSAPLTIKGTKIVLDAIARNQTDLRNGAITEVMDEAMASADYREGVTAFAEKRDPRFRGE